MSVALTSEDISRVITRISHEILEKNSDPTSITILGIPTRGADLAYRIAESILVISGITIPVGALDITLHRDDLRIRPPRPLMDTFIPAAGVEGRTVILVDDVLFSGRTIRSALDALGEVGRPARVQLAVLVDRGHRELPIRADYVGKNLPTSLTQSVKVSLLERDGADEVSIDDVRAGQAL
jgi:pyrimidine operon attenuation protein/uracil phosphoribosyltransferase